MSIYKKENPEYFVATMDSILEQTLQPEEILLVKDGPLTEELDGLIDEYNQQLGEQFTIYSLKENQGLGIALAKGVEQCRNNLIARMDTDDIMAANRLEVQYELFKSQPQLAIVGSDIIEFEGTLDYVLGTRVVPKTNEEIRIFSKRRNPFNHMTVMFKKEAIISSGNYQPLNGFEDYYLWVRVLKNGYQALNISEKLVYARTGADMYSRRGGWRYFKNGLSGRKIIYKAGLGSFNDFFISSTAHVIVSLFPNNIRGKFYERFLRKNG